MRNWWGRKPSAALVVAVVALAVALSGTAIAASGRVSGDKLIKKGSLSGNRLRSHTLTGKQVNVAKLGKVRSAAEADIAAEATKAANATNSTNAAELGGRQPSEYALADLLGAPAPEATNSGVDDSACYLTEVRLLAGNQVPANWHLADGTLLSISSNIALFSLLGTTYGGNGTTTFALPDLRAAAPRGGGRVGVNYYICTTGTFP
jgi:tail collar domain